MKSSDAPKAANELPGGVAEAARPSYFSPDEVRMMSLREVRENYDAIFESMRHWQ